MNDETEWPPRTSRISFEELDSFLLADVDFYKSQRPELLKKHFGEYVAIRGKKILGYANSREELIDRITDMDMEDFLLVV